MKLSPIHIVASTLILLPISAATAAETVTYTYDALGRLVKKVVTGTVNNGVQVEYTHDAADNRTKVKVTGASQ